MRTSACTWSSAASSSSTCRWRRSPRWAPRSRWSFEAGGHGEHSSLVYFVSLGFTLVGAAIFAMVRTQRSRIPQEAIIGICYAVAAAASILAMSKAPSETRAPHRACWSATSSRCPGPKVFKTAALYAAVGAFHYVFRKQFLAISVNHDHPERTGLRVRWWDFLFYASFGVVVTSSVSIAGVLLVFCYLIVPSVAAMLYSEHIGTRLAIGWTMGTIVSGVGVYLSLDAGLPDRGHDRLHVRRRAAC